MAKEVITKELAQKLMEAKGECRGMNLKIDWDFILNREGKEGIKKIENKMAELGYPLKYKEIRPMDFYPIGMDGVSMLVISEVFNFDDKDIEELGASAVKFSLLMKVFMKYFVSLRMVADELPKMWPKHYTLGMLEMPEFSTEKRYVLLQLKNFHVHPIFCTAFKGYFTKVTGMMVKAKVISQETKCTFKGDKFHEYLIKW